MGEVDGEGMILMFFLERFLLFFCFFLVVLAGGGGAAVTVDDSLALVLVHELEEEEMVSERFLLRLDPGAATASAGALALHMPHRLSWGLLAYVHREQDHVGGCSCSSSGDGGAVCATCSKAFSNDTVAGEVGAAMVVPPRVLICGSMGQWVWVVVAEQLNVLMNVSVRKI